MLSLAELRRAAEVITSRLAGSRLERATQPEADRLELELYGRDPSSEQGSRTRLLLCCDARFGRVAETSIRGKSPEKPPAFVSWVRAHVVGGRLAGAEILAGDRQLLLAFETREGRCALVLSLLGRRSNLYAVDESRALVAALRPLAETRPELGIGEPYRSPERGVAEVGEDRFRAATDGDFLTAVEAEYAPLEEHQAAADLARHLATALRKERKSAERRLEKIEAELAEAEQASGLQRRGELLKGVLGRIAKGDTEVRATDYETGEDEVIPLDPTLTPRENLDATFKRYQKLLRRLTKAGGQVDDARAWFQEVTALEAEAAQIPAAGASAQEELEALADRPAVARLLGRQRARSQRPEDQKAKKTSLPTRLRDLPRRLLPRRYASRDGLEIWVGRSDEGNDHLTTRLARGNDLFFHLDGAPGSHVILRTEGRTDPPSESVLDACELAVHFSKQKNAGRADVHVVPIKQVKKPKGAKRGLVFVTGGRSIHLRREEARLARLLAARFDD